MQNRGSSGQRTATPPGPAALAPAACSDAAAPPSTREATQHITLVGKGTVPDPDSVVVFERVTSGGQVVDGGITDPVFDRDGALQLSSSLHLREGATYHYTLSIARYPEPAVAQSLSCEVATASGKRLAQIESHDSDEVTCSFRFPGDN
ncbi:hypothetical protein ATY41_09455 [Leifsonia xyli subsp. xyli]|uniref:Uncharacterized protein n=2 Tax=Leifsonia xyli subsp. xyli TaxID=59736 RepID=Q6ACU2_LEIXX|nr:hypothetical protein [Leifsonia xyli]AAT89801.1 hypothetical protein Lxx21030 [Leifsonia xyli subsp. xyli str. CTCB07]ODA90639.1 hypothetical protein ATY41_09455 [Leifsonia xyli subsp. xyli]